LPARFNNFNFDMDNTQSGMSPSRLRTRDTDVKGTVTTFEQLFADPNPSIEITSASLASHREDGHSCSKQFRDSEMDWRRGRKRVEGMEPENKLSLTSQFNNLTDGAFQVEGEEEDEEIIQVTCEVILVKK
jgi:hypothetical protein